MKLKAGFIILFAAVFMLNGCKKEDSTGGRKIIEGIIYFHDGTTPQSALAPGAIVYVTYDSKTYTGEIDQTTTTDSKGEYRVKGLTSGDYFISAKYTTSSGFTYTTAGHGVTIASNKNKAIFNFTLY